MADEKDQPESDDPFELSFDEEAPKEAPTPAPTPAPAATPSPAAQKPAAQAPPPPPPSRKPLIALGAVSALALVMSVATGLVATRGLSKANMYMEAADATLQKAVKFQDAGHAVRPEQIEALAAQQRQLLEQVAALSETVTTMKETPATAPAPQPSTGINQAQIAAAVTRSLDARFARYEQIMRSQAGAANELRRAAQAMPRTASSGGGDAAALREIKASQATIARRLDELSAKVGQLQRATQAAAQKDEMIRYP